MPSKVALYAATFGGRNESLAERRGRQPRGRSWVSPDEPSTASLDAEVQPGERLPDELLEGAQTALERHMAKPTDIADAVLYTVSLPHRLHIADIVIRPAKSMQLR